MKIFLKVAFFSILLSLTLQQCSEKDDGDENETPVSATPASTPAPLVLKDNDGNELGKVLFADWPKVGLRLANDGEMVVRAADGRFLGGLCEDSYCTASFAAAVRPSGDIYGYCYFENSNCSGTCLLAAKPMKNSVFRKSDDEFVIADGEESASTKSVVNAYASDESDCVTSGGITTTSFYPVTESYEFPDDATFPFSAPLTIE